MERSWNVIQFLVLCLYSSRNETLIPNFNSEIRNTNSCTYKRHNNDTNRQVGATRINRILIKTNHVIRWSGEIVELMDEVITLMSKICLHPWPELSWMYFIIWQNIQHTFQNVTWYSRCPQNCKQLSRQPRNHSLHFFWVTPAKKETAREHNCHLQHSDMCYEDHLLRYNRVYFCRQVPAFCRNLPSPISSKKSLICQSVWCHTSEHCTGT